MVQIGNIPEIQEIKEKLGNLEQVGLIDAWELPYENLFTRLDAAIFFLSPTNESEVEKIWGAINEVGNVNYQRNEKQLLSKLPWQFQIDEGDV